MTEKKKRLSDHFWQKEFDCQCGCGLEFVVHKSLLVLLENIRVALKSPFIITSGARCEKHNLSVGGSPNSWHVPRAGKWGPGILYASDIRSSGSVSAANRIETLKLYTLANLSRAQGLGLYPRRIHVDMRPTKIRALWIHDSWKWDL